MKRDRLTISKGFIQPSVIVVILVFIVIATVVGLIIYKVPTSKIIDNESIIKSPEPTQNSNNQATSSDSEIETLRKEVESLKKDFKNNPPISNNKPNAVSPSQAPVLDKYKLFKSIVNLTCVNSNETIIKRGSGVIVSPDGKIISNYHLISNPGLGDIIGDLSCVGEVITKENSYIPDSSFLVSFLYSNPSADITLGIIENTKQNIFPFLKINYKVEVGETVYTAGYPDTAKGSISLSKGVVSSKVKNKGYDYLLSDAAISFGSSGGAAVNEKGELLGLTTSASVSEISSAAEILQINILSSEKIKTQELLSSYPEQYKYLLQNQIEYLNNILSLNGIK